MRGNGKLGEWNGVEMRPGERPSPTPKQMQPGVVGRAGPSAFATDFGVTGWAGRERIQHGCGVAEQQGRT